ncbi:MAG: hypothetical protein AMXMBFR82_52810 [Candidatus Hydrogenedentota bacterium]
MQTGVTAPAMASWIRFMCGVSLGLVLGVAVDADTQEGATISGVVRYTGAIPTAKLADNEGKHRAKLSVNPSNGGLAYAMVYLALTDGQTPPVTGDVDDLAKVTIEQVDYEFHPRVVGVRPGQTVAIGNQDYANHNVRATALNSFNAFNVMTPADGAYERVLKEEPAGGPIRLSCDIHPWMSGWIYVFDHPWFDVTDDAGQFKIERIPPGHYTLRIVQPDVKLSAQTELEVKTGMSLTAEIDFSHELLGQKAEGTIHMRKETQP